jgi:hypothetical protein
VGKYQLLVNDCAPRTERINGSSVRRRKNSVPLPPYKLGLRGVEPGLRQLGQYRLDVRAVEVRSPAEAKDLSSSFLSNGYRGPFALRVNRDRGVMLTTHFHIVARSRMSRSCISCLLVACKFPPCCCCLHLNALQRSVRHNRPVSFQLTVVSSSVTSVLHLTFGRRPCGRRMQPATR